MDLALNNLQMLICHKTKQTKPIKQTLFPLKISLLSHPSDVGVVG